MRKRGSNLRAMAKTLARRKESFAQHVAGKSLSQIAEQFGVSEKTIDRDIRTELQTASFYPSSLDGQQIAELRMVEGERLSKLWQRVQLALDMIQPRLGTEGERSLDGTAIARLVASGVAVSEQISRLFGLHAPTKVISEMFKLEVTKSEHTVTVSFDKNQLKPTWAPVGLVVVPPDDDTGPRQLANGTSE